jgi:hypothetical protein
MAVTKKSDFSEEEWARIRRAPFVAGMAISIADPGGPIELTKETMASIRSASVPPGEEELLLSVAQDSRAMMQQRQNPMGDFKPSKGALAGQEILDELRAVNEIVIAKATAEEAAAFQDWLKATAQAAAEAAKEGGFMGFRAEQVSKGEQSMLDQLASVLGDK